MSDGRKLNILSEDKIGRILKRMSIQIFENNLGVSKIVLVGINGKGYEMASRLQKILKSVNDMSLTCDLAELIIQTDIEIDEMFKEIFIELTSESTKKNDILTSQDLANFIIIAKSLERIGDHATNVAEIIIFQSKGIIPSKDLRSS